MIGMRIAKNQAVMALRAENEMLRAQRSRCESQARHMSGMALRGLKGKAASELERCCVRHAAIVASHVVFYDSLIDANAQNIGLVEGLPETSAGVVDTQVAERRMGDAQARVTELRKRRDQAIQLAERTNEELQTSLLLSALNAAITVPPSIDTSVIRREYEALIRAEELVVRLNREILDKAAEYDRKSAALYGSVSIGALRCSEEASSHFVRTGAWGDDSWMATVRASVLFARGRGHPEDTSGAGEILEAFIGGGLKLEKSLVSGDAQASLEGEGLPINGSVAGSVLGLGLSLKPFAKAEDDKDAGGKKKSKVGAKAEGKLYGAQGEATGSVGVVRGTAEVTALSGAVSGTVGASLFDNGSLDPSLKLGAKAEASAVEVQADVQVGGYSLNAHTKAEAQVLTASAEAGIELSDEQVGIKAGAEAYVATGEILAGITLMGVKVDVALEGKAGGAGAHANASVGTTSVEGCVGAGLGLGAGVKVKVDWSGAGRAISHMGEGNADWWSDIGDTQRRSD